MTNFRLAEKKAVGLIFFSFSQQVWQFLAQSFAVKATKRKALAAFNFFMLWEKVPGLPSSRTHEKYGIQGGQRRRAAIEASCGGSL
jgi:hypothetical protein